MATIRRSIWCWGLAMALSLATGCAAPDTTTLAASPDAASKAPEGFRSEECELTSSDGTKVLVTLAIPDGSPRQPSEDRAEDFPGGFCGFGQWTDAGSGAVYLAEDAKWSPRKMHEHAKSGEGDGGDEGTELAKYDDSTEMFGGLDGALESHWSYSDSVPTYVWLAQAGGVTLHWSILQADASSQPHADGVDLSVAKTVRDSVRITTRS